MSFLTHSLQAPCPRLHTPPPPTPYLRERTPNQSHSHAQDAQTTSTRHAPPHQPHIENPEDGTDPRLTLYPSTTLHTSIRPPHAPSPPGYVNFQSPCMLTPQSHTPTHPGHKLHESFLLYDRMHHGLSKWETTPHTSPRHISLQLQPPPGSLCTKRVTHTAEPGHTLQHHTGLDLAPHSTEPPDQSYPPNISCNGNQHYSPTFPRCHRILHEPIPNTPHT